MKSWIRARVRRAIRDERGEQLIEYALCSMVFMTLALGICDVSRAMCAYNFVTHGAQQGARWATLRGASWGSACSTSAPPSFSDKFACTASSTDVQNYVKGLSAFNPSNITVSTTWPATTPGCSSSCTVCSTANNQGCFVKVKVTYKFKFLVPFFKQNFVNFTASSVKVIQT